MTVWHRSPVIECFRIVCVRLRVCLLTRPTEQSQRTGPGWRRPYHYYCCYDWVLLVVVTAGCFRRRPRPRRRRRRRARWRFRCSP